MTPDAGHGEPNSLMLRCTVTPRGWGAPWSSPLSTLYFARERVSVGDRFADAREHDLVPGDRITGDQRRLLPWPGCWNLQFDFIDESWADIWVWADGVRPFASRLETAELWHVRLSGRQLELEYVAAQR